MDITHDNSWNNLIQITAKLDGDIPAYIKEYTPLNEKSASILSDKLFADERNRMFPMDSQANTWLSSAYFMYNKNELPYKEAEFNYVKSRIDSAAKVYGIVEDISKLAKALDVQVSKEASKATHIALADFPMHDAAGVMKASEFFSQYRHKYPSDWRYAIAKDIMCKAAEFEVQEDSLADAVRKEAGYGIPDKNALMEEILYRASMAKHADSAAALANINFMVAELPIEEISNNFNKIAKLLADYDVAEGLDDQYNKKLMPPADAVFGVAIKDAEAIINDALKLNKYVFSITKLAEEIAPSVFDNLLGEGFVKDLTKDSKLVPVKLGQALDKLPDEDKAALEEYLQNAYTY